MSLFASLVARSDAGTVVAECRRCGTTVDPDTSVCGTCDSEGIVRYDID
ncbi:hypothetical protein [Halosimplex halobium]